jgi:YggT family protein
VFMLVQTAYILLDVLWWIIFASVIMSWLISFNVINTHNDVVRTIWQALETITEPLYRPIRRILPDFGALDLSPLVVLLAISILQRAVLPQILMSLT